MVSIQDALASIALEKYSDAFNSSGFTTLEDFFALSPGDLEGLLTEIGMLKGHTFKLKKLIEDTKAGVSIKPKPAPAIPSNITSYMPIKQVPSVPIKEPAKPVELNHGRDLIERSNVIKSQLATVLQSKESMINSLKQLVEMDLSIYFQALAQLKAMQSSIKGLLQADIEMIDN